MPPPSRPAPPGADEDLPPIVDHRRAAAVALALAAEPEALAGAFVDLGLPALPRKVSVALPTDEGEAWVVFDRAGKLLSSHPPGWPPRGAVAADLKALVAARAELAGADQVGVRRVEALLRSCLDRAAELTRGEFVQVERLMPLVWGRALEIIGDTIENGLGFADTYRHIDARKRDNGALLWAQWQRMQGLGHLALALNVDHEALYAVSEGPPAGGDEEAPPSPHGLMEPLLNFGLLGPYLRGVRALATLGNGFVENLLHTHQVETDYPRLREALLDLPALTAAALVDKKAAPEVIRLLEDAAAAAPPADPADPSTAALQQLTAGLLALLKSPKGERRARRAWLRDRLAQSPALTEHLGAPPPEGAVPATETTSAGESAGAESSGAKTTGEGTPSEPDTAETSASEPDTAETSADAAEKAQEAWDHRALVALLNRPVDWRVEPTLFIELVIRMLPWLAQSAPRDLYPSEPLAAVFTEPPPVTWLHQHTLLCQASGRPAPIVREAPKVGRNEPCPCGSGKKYKKCCGG